MGGGSQDLLLLGAAQEASTALQAANLMAQQHSDSVHSLRLSFFMRERKNKRRVMLKF